MQEPVNIKSTERLPKGENPVAGVGLLHKAFAVLDLFQTDRPDWTQADLARAADLPRSTASRVVRYFVQTGYLRFDSSSRTYALGPAAADLARRAAGAGDLATLSHDVLEDISRRTRETVMLTRYDPAGSAVICVDQVPSLHEGLQVFERIGARFPLYAGATAKAVLAALPDGVRARVLAGPIVAVGSAAPVDAAQLSAEVETIRARGYATSQEETYPGASGVGVAILGPSGPVGSIAVAAPIYRMTPVVEAHVTRLLIDGAARIGARLAGQSMPDPDLQ